MKSLSEIRLKYAVLLVLAAFLVAGLAGCAATKQARGVKTSGFLGDYTMLEKGAKGEALLIYKNPKADWPSYSKIQLDPVVIWRQGELKSTDIPKEDLQRLANNFHQLLQRELSQDYEMVSAPGPRTLRLQVALTDVEESDAAVDTVTSVIPVGMVISGAKDFATGKPAFTGEASVEAKITDGRTGELLAAAVDRRVGGETIEASVDNWDDVNKIIEIWSKLLRFRLCKNRGDKDCTDPVQ
jgi:hypothetical protein